MDFREHLRDAMEAAGLTYAGLLQRTRLPCTVSSLCRKLNGLQVLALDEAVPIARVLDVPLAGADRCRALERALGASFVWPAAKRSTGIGTPAATRAHKSGKARKAA